MAEEQPKNKVISMAYVCLNCGKEIEDIKYFISCVNCGSRILVKRRSNLAKEVSTD